MFLRLFSLLDINFISSQSLTSGHSYRDNMFKAMLFYVHFLIMICRYYSIDLHSRIWFQYLEYYGSICCKLILRTYLQRIVFLVKLISIPSFIHHGLFLKLHYLTISYSVIYILISNSLTTYVSTVWPEYRQRVKADE